MTKHRSLESKFRSEAGVNPTAPKAGDIFYNTVGNGLMRFDGIKFTGIAFGSTPTTSTSTTTSTSITTSTSTTSTSTSLTTSTSITTSTSTTTTL